MKYAKLALALSEFATVRVVVTAKSTCFTGAVSEDYDADSLASFAKSGMSVLSDEDEWNTYTSGKCLQRQRYVVDTLTGRIPHHDDLTTSCASARECRAAY